MATPRPPDTAPAEADPRTAAGLLDRAWALKAACYAAWNTDPPAALQAAQALQQLRLSQREAPAALCALADWTAGIACLIRSEMADALSRLDEASVHWQAAGQPLHAAQAQVPKLMALAVLGRFDEAETCALATEAALRRHGDTLAAAKVRLNLGSLAFSRDQHARAAEHYRAAAVRFAQAGDREHSVMADIGLADALSYLGRLDEAHQGYRRAAERAQAHDLPVLAAAAENGSALVALSQGRYREALAGLEATRRAFDSLSLEHRREEAEKSLADAYLALRLLPEAVALYQALLIDQRRRGALATLPWTLAQLAQAQALMGQPAQGLVLLTEAAAGFEAQDNPAGRATVLAVQADLQAALGQAGPALASARQAAAAFGAADLPMHRQAAELLASEARLATGDASRALAEATNLVQIGELSPPLRMRALALQATACLALHRRAEGRAALEAVIEGIEDLRNALPGEDLQRAWLADASRPYAQRLALALDDAQDQADGPAEVLHWLERFKARALRERLGRPALPAPAGAGQHALRHRLDWLYRRLQRQLEDEGESPQALRAEATRLEQQLLESARRERLAQAGTDQAGSVAPLNLAVLQQALGPDRALVEFGAAGDELFAIVLQPQGLHLQRRLASLSAVQQAVGALQFQIDTLRAANAVPAEHLPQLCERTRRRLASLYRLIWQPLQPLVKASRRLVIVPHGPLHRLPFAALGERDDDCLVDHHDLVLAASAAVAAAGLSRPVHLPAQPAALLLGDTRQLPHVAAELAAVGQALGLPAEPSARAPALAAWQTSAASADVLHLACHGEFRADSPLFSALHLDDTTLTADQVQAQPLRARLVVLSACESGQGDLGATDEGVGLVRAFLMAGAASVLASPWAVDDAATAACMAHFYRRWAAGAGAAAALAAAQRDQRRQWPHPAHWAAFALHGAG